jgi:two-component system response regulator AtoC
VKDGLRHVLIVDAHDEIVARTRAALTGIEVEAVNSIASAFDRIVSSTFDVVLFDPELGGEEDGALALLHRMRTIAPDSVVVMWIEEPTVGFAVRAMRAGALDVLKKSAEAPEIRSVTERAISHGALAREVRRLRGEVEAARGLGEVIGASPLMRQLFAMIDRVAASDATVLIVGESGTGKELLARAIHRVHPCASGPFVGVNCSALPVADREPSCSATRRARSPARTAATSAGCSARPTAARSSSTRSASSPRALQNKLLRVLQEREVKPVGGDRTSSIDVRVVAATNKNLETMLADGSFREDLYYRLTSCRRSISSAWGTARGSRI